MWKLPAIDSWPGGNCWPVPFPALRSPVRDTTQTIIFQTA